MSEPQLFSMGEVAAKLRKSKRWLYYYLKANPHGRFVGRSRMFTEADLVKLIDSLPRAGQGDDRLPLAHGALSSSARFQARLDRLPNHRPRKTPKGV